jgi:hypothetical protein
MTWSIQRSIKKKVGFSNMSQLRYVLVSGSLSLLTAGNGEGICFPDSQLNNPE